MHRYLRAVGFSNIENKKQVRELLNDVIINPNRKEFIETRFAESMMTRIILLLISIIRLFRVMRSPLRKRSALKDMLTRNPLPECVKTIEWVQRSFTMFRTV